MEELLKQFAGHIGLAIEVVGILVIAIGSLEAVVAVARLLFTGGPTDTQRRAVWLRYAYWLGAGLTFQLAGDIVHTAIAPTWDAIGQLAAIAAVRTFLTFFLERDLEEVRERQRAESRTEAA